MARGSSRGDEFVWLVLIMLVVVLLSAWFKFKAFAEMIGVDPGALLESLALTAVIGIGWLFAIFKGVVSTKKASPVALLFTWFSWWPVFDSLALKAQAFSNFITDTDQIVQPWYNSWWFLWGIAALLSFWCYRAITDDSY